jgi:hypothetical protein
MRSPVRFLAWIVYQSSIYQTSFAVEASGIGLQASGKTFMPQLGRAEKRRGRE